MPELRKDYVTDTWVVFSTVRSKRPEEFRPSRTTTPAEKCPFCPGHEHMTPPEILAYRKDGHPNGSGWRNRCVPNKYPALEVEGEVHRRARQMFHSVNGGGAHEVIVETPQNEANLSALSDFQAHEMAFEDFTDEERTPLARILKDVLGRLNKVLDDPPFNYYIHTAPTDRKESRYHWHFEITPRLTETAGFERGTGFYINPMMPEDAATIIRGKVKPGEGPR